MSRHLSITPEKFSNSFRHAIQTIMVCVALVFSSSVYAGNFAVTPIRLELNTANKSGAITIRNEADNDLNVQIDLYEWTQGENGKDIYKKSDDLIYFPHLARILSGESRVVRIGLRQAKPLLQEKQYRLYIEELPGKRKQKGMALAVAVRFGVPVFIKPAEVKPAGKIEQLGMQKGKIRLLIRNTGNTHFKISSIEANSGKLYTDKISGWYLLPGSMREYLINVPENKCINLKRIDIKVKTDLLELRDALNISPELCR